MIETVILDINYTKGLTKNLIEKNFKEKNLDVIKWAVVGFKDNTAKILTTFIKKN